MMMGSRIRRSRMTVFALALTVLATAAVAHHSGAMFDRTKTVALKGTVKEFLFTNPHCWIELLVVDKGRTPVVWDIEASAPTRLVRWGISPQTVHSGDKITLIMHPLRDGRTGGSLVSIIFADGKRADTDTDVNATSAK